MAEAALKIILVDDGAAAPNAPPPPDPQSGPPGPPPTQSGGPPAPPDAPVAAPVAAPPDNPSPAPSKKPDKDRTSPTPDKAEKAQRDAFVTFAQNLAQHSGIGSLLRQFDAILALLRDVIAFSRAVTKGHGDSVASKITQTAGRSGHEGAVDSAITRPPTPPPSPPPTPSPTPPAPPPPPASPPPPAPSPTPTPTPTTPPVPIPPPPPPGTPVTPPPVIVPPVASGPAAGGATTGAVASQTPRAAAGGVAGAAAVGVAVFAAAILAAGIAVKKFSDMVRDQAQKLDAYSPNVSVAVSETELRRERAMLDRGQRIGPEVAKWERLRGKAEENFMRLGTEILAAIIKIFDTFEPAIKAGVKGIEVGTVMVEPIGKFLEIMADTAIGDVAELVKDVKEQRDILSKLPKRLADAMAEDKDDDFPMHDPFMDQFFAIGGPAPAPRAPGRPPRRP